MAAAYLNIKKLKGAGKVLAAARHNLREIQAELGAVGHIDPSKTGLNRVMAGPGDAAAVARQAEQETPPKLRKDAVRGLEVVISLPPGQARDSMAFFSDGLAWVRGYFAVPVLSAVAHHDEAEPHLHVLLLPLKNGRMAGSDLVGNRARLRDMQSAFHQAVASRYGLTRPVATRRPSKAFRDAAAAKVIDVLSTAPECLSQPNVRLALTEAIAHDPDALMTALGLTLPAQKPKRTKSFVEIMTSPTQAKAKRKPIGFVKHPSPIGFEPDTAHKNDEPYLCVGFAHSTPENEPSYIRTRDDQDAHLWDSEQGKFRSAPKPTVTTSRHH